MKEGYEFDFIDLAWRNGHAGLLRCALNAITYDGPLKWLEYVAFPSYVPSM